MVEDVFVPDAFVWQLRPQMPRGPHFSDALYRFPFLGLFSWPMAAVALGVAQRALDEMTAMALATGNRGAWQVMRYCWDTVDQAVAPDAVIAAIDRAGMTALPAATVAGVFIEYRGQKPSRA